MAYDVDYDAGPKAETTSVLFARTMSLVAFFVGTTGIFSYLTLSWTPTSWVLAAGMIVALFALTWWAMSLAHDNNGSAVIPAWMVSALFGCLLGPTLNMYIKTLGVGTVLQCCVVTGGATTAGALFAYTMNIPYRTLESLLMIPLLGLVLFGFYEAFTGITTGTANLTYSLIGLVVFFGFFLVDFARLKDESQRGITGWGAATSLAVNIYLDILNFLLYLLRAAKDD